MLGCDAGVTWRVVMVMVRVLATALVANERLSREDDRFAKR